MIPFKAGKPLAGIHTWLVETRPLGTLSPDPCDLPLPACAGTSLSQQHGGRQRLPAQRATLVSGRLHTWIGRPPEPRAASGRGIPGTPYSSFPSFWLVASVGGPHQPLSKTRCAAQSLFEERLLSPIARVHDTMGDTRNPQSQCGVPGILYPDSYVLFPARCASRRHSDCAYIGGQTAEYLNRF
jgi:hypothetical protein